MSKRPTTSRRSTNVTIKKTRSLDLVIHAQVGKAYVPYLRKQLQNVAQIFPSPLQSLSLAVVNDKEMSRLHVQFMNIQGPTDVLTFPLEMTPKGQATEGEVIICLPEARRRAKDVGVEVRDELLLYAVHGILHLAGMDDRTQRDFDLMHRTEDNILAKLGVGKIFHHPGKPKSNLRNQRGGRR